MDAAKGELQEVLADAGKGDQEEGQGVVVLGVELDEGPKDAEEGVPQDGEDEATEDPGAGKNSGAPGLKWTSLPGPNLLSAGEEED